MVHHVESQEQYDKLKSAATGLGCGPCKMIAPAYEAMSKEHTDVVFIHVDVDKLQDLPDGQDVRGVPTFKFFKGGKLITQFSGASKDKLENTVKANK